MLARGCRVLRRGAVFRDGEYGAGVDARFQCVADRVYFAVAHGISGNRLLSYRDGAQDFAGGVGDGACRGGAGGVQRPFHSGTIAGRGFADGGCGVVMGVLLPDSQAARCALSDLVHHAQGVFLRGGDGVAVFAGAAVRVRLAGACQYAGVDESAVFVAGGVNVVFHYLESGGQGDRRGAGDELYLSGSAGGDADVRRCAG